MPRPNAKLIARQEARLTARLLRRWKKQIADLLVAMKAIPFTAPDKAGKGIPMPGCDLCGEQACNCPKPLERKDAVEHQIGDIVDGLEGYRETVEDVVAIARPSYKAGVKWQGARLPLAKYGISFDITNPDAEEYMRKLRDLNLSNYRGSISRTTKDRIKQILVESVRASRTYDETAKLIQEQGNAGVFSRERGKVIAVNQVGNAHEEGKRKVVQRFTAETGVPIVKNWQTSEDDRVTEECREYENMGAIPMDQAFTSSSGTSDQRAPRKTNPRCRCNTAYTANDSQE